MSSLCGSEMTRKKINCRKSTGGTGPRLPSRAIGVASYVALEEAATAGLIMGPRASRDLLGTAKLQSAPDAHNPRYATEH